MEVWLVRSRDARRPWWSHVGLYSSWTAVLLRHPDAGAEMPSPSYRRQWRRDGVDYEARLEPVQA